MASKAQERPLIERVAALAMKLVGRYLADYGAARSRHDFTQRQLMSCLILRAYLKTTYRGVLELLSVSPSLRKELGLDEKLPHCTTLQKFSARTKVMGMTISAATTPRVIALNQFSNVRRCIRIGSARLATAVPR